MAVQILCNASQVAAGGGVTLSPAAGVSINGAPGASWRIVRTTGSTSPWMAWVQHETGNNAYSLLAIGATTTAIAGDGGVYEAGVYEDDIYTADAPTVAAYEAGIYETGIYE